MTATKTKKASAIDYVDNLVDNAFTPDMTDRENQRGTTMQDKLRTDSGARQVNADELPTLAEVMNDLGDLNLDGTYTGKPEAGKHMVTLYSVSEPKRGADNNYITIELRDNDIEMVWKANVNTNKLREWYDTINKSNQAMLKGLNWSQAIRKLKATPFYCWTINKVENESTLSYFSEYGFEKYARYKARREAEIEEAKLKAKEKEDNDGKVKAESRRGGNRRPTEAAAIA